MEPQGRKENAEQPQHCAGAGAGARVRLRPEMLAFFLKGSYKTIKIHRKKKNSKQHNARKGNVGF